MTKKTTRLGLLATIAFSAIVLNSCILGGTCVLDIMIPGPFRYTFDGTDKGSFDGAHVDITQEQVWMDHRDDIDRIESVHFGGKVTNNTGMDDLVSMYISTSRYLSDIELHAGNDVYPVLLDMHIPADADMLLIKPSSTIEYRVSDPKIIKMTNEIVLGGIFYTYAVGQNANYDLTFRECDYHVVFSASK